MFSSICALALLALVKAKCPIGTFQGIRANDCYFFSQGNDYGTWYQSQQACAKKGGDLMSIPNGLVNDFITTRLQTCKTEYWIGALWEYPDGWIWSDGTEMQYTNWSAGEPSVNGDYCAYIDYADSQWHTSRCHNNIFYVNGSFPSSYYICKIPPVATQSSKCVSRAVSPLSASQPCEPGWTRSIGSKCHKLLDTVVKYIADARKLCNLQGADLPSIRAVEENNKLMIFAMQQSVKAHGVHLGLVLHPQRGWSWLDGNRANFTNWKDIPDATKFNASTVLWTSVNGGTIGKWYPAKASVSYGVICEKE